MSQASTGPRRVALITGGGTGMGFAGAAALVRADFDVVILGRRTDVLEAAVAQLPAGRASYIEADVGTFDGPARAVEETVARHGRLDCLVTAAAIFDEVRMLEMSLEQWEATININLRGTWLAAQAAGRQMVEQGSGRMILFGSIAAVQSEGVTALHYSASKAAVHSLAQTLGISLASHGIQVNAIAPGLVETPMTTAAVQESSPEAIANLLPTARVCQPNEVGELVRFLAVDAPPSMVGSILTIDSGQTIAMRFLGQMR
jgi:NAD(P)-dependent dehydrogenase (short-subunit alcohol dehydrogenase family)